MGYFELIQQYDHEQVVFCSDKATGLRAFIGIHDRTLGPGLGGCRMKPYASEEEALQDVLDLSRAMTFKNAVAGLDKGGGKTVVILNKPEDKTPELLQALAYGIDQLKGTYFGAGDVGSSAPDLEYMGQFTKFVAGFSQEKGGLGDSSILTALGVFKGIQACVKEKLGRDDLEGLTVAVQGCGKVGYNLIGHLIQAGCHVVTGDINSAATAKVQTDFPSAKIVPIGDILNVQADILSPNAVGGFVTPQVAQSLNASIVAGGANNILSSVEAGEILHSRGILFAPDYVINCGGVIVLDAEIEGRTLEDAKKHTEGVYERALDVFKLAKAENLTPSAAAYETAMRRIRAARK